YGGHLPSMDAAGTHRTGVSTSPRPGARRHDHGAGRAEFLREPCGDVCGAQGPGLLRASLRQAHAAPVVTQLLRADDGPERSGRDADAARRRPGRVPRVAAAGERAAGAARTRPSRSARGAVEGLRAAHLPRAASPAALIV